MNTMEMSERKMVFLVPDELDARLQDYAKWSDPPLARVLREAIREYLDAEEQRGGPDLAMRIRSVFENRFRRDRGDRADGEQLILSPSGKPRLVIDPIEGPIGYRWADGGVWRFPEPQPIEEWSDDEWIDLRMGRRVDDGRNMTYAANRPEHCSHPVLTTDRRPVRAPVVCRESPRES